MPSVFGQNNLKFNPKDDFIISAEEDYLNDIIKDISNKINLQRAVIVFFEDEKKIK